MPGYVLLFYDIRPFGFAQGDNKCAVAHLLSLLKGIQDFF